MSCLIVLQDGRACAPAAWVFDAMLNAFADELVESPEEQLLGDWLRSQSTAASAGPMRRIDVRELTPESRVHFLRAVHRAAERISDPSGGWRKRLVRLARMLHSIDAGESPDALSDTPSPVAPTGLRRGPGWRCAC